MSHPNKDKVQADSREILHKSGRVEVEPGLWVAKEIAVKEWGYAEPDKGATREKVSDTAKSGGMLKALARQIIGIPKL